MISSSEQPALLQCFAERCATRAATAVTIERWKTHFLRQRKEQIECLKFNRAKIDPRNFVWKPYRRLLGSIPNKNEIGVKRGGARLGVG
jgi:hypothetical protein